MFDRYHQTRAQRAQTNEGGFTLVELLIVIVVLGILAAVTVLGLSNFSGQSLTSACHADEKSVEVAQEAWHAQNQDYAPSIQELVTPPAGAGGPYLRTPPGNADKYTIATNGQGQVLVNGTDFDTAANATPPTDPCENLPSTPPTS